MQKKKEDDQYICLDDQVHKTSLLNESQRQLSQVHSHEIPDIYPR
jgi:hypothetical protein